MPYLGIPVVGPELSHPGNRLSAAGPTTAGSCKPRGYGGTAPALGRLESVSPTGIDDLVAAVRDVVGTVAQRDADVGGDVEVWTLPADAGGT